MTRAGLGSPAWWLAGLLVLVAALGGCATAGRPPVVDHSPVFAARPALYTVRKGDTLYSIAWRFNLDFRALASANGIGKPYAIFPGQELRLIAQQKPRGAKPAQPAAGQGGSTTSGSGAIAWSWPVEGTVTRAFGKGNNGIDYGLSHGHRIRTAAAGRVVYSGNGLGGYRYLVIVKHSEHYLSAYSLNATPLVVEGAPLKARAVLADVTARTRSAAALHFEIRKDGDPLNPNALIGR